MARAAITLTLMLALLACISTASGQEDFTLRGWTDPSEVVKAIDFARENDRPLVFMYIQKQPSTEVARLAQAWGGDASMRNKVRVLVYSTDKGPFEEVRKQVSDTATAFPRLYFSTPQLQVTGFVAPREPRRVRGVAGLASSIDTWRRGVPRELERADQLAEQGRYGSALRLVRAVAEADVAQTMQAHSTWLTLPPVGMAAEVAQARGGRRTAAPAPPPPGAYFPGLLDERTKTYQAQATARLAEAKKHAAAGETAEARRLLAPLAADGADFDEAAEARALLTELATADAARPPDRSQDAGDEADNKTDDKAEHDAPDDGDA
jgi:hypothetical protein